MHTGKLKDRGDFRTSKLLHVYFRPEMIDQVRIVAGIEGRTVSEIVREAVARFVMQWNNANKDPNNRLPVLPALGEDDDAAVS